METAFPNYEREMSMEEFFEWLNKFLKKKIEELDISLKRIEIEINDIS